MSAEAIRQAQSEWLGRLCDGVTHRWIVPAARYFGAVATAPKHRAGRRISLASRAIRAGAPGAPYHSSLCMALRQAQGERPVFKYYLVALGLVLQTLPAAPDRLSATRGIRA